ncbi:Uncharacterized protein DBV15_00895 [Temnothorax longispinosus]|uniref:Uncharacterized protein n=1 Tax=Temnothorax longispinosus TaxID=300112 RepID=A0A4S2JEP8_9HYME|nr:Uncharacterized protein DBV15_00895 [Temnothorax longispinosus]
MMDPPRHTCRGRPMVCPGPCNPLKAHHHHHHRRHHRQKPDMTGAAVPEKGIPLPDEFSQITLLRSLMTDTSVTSATSTDDTSISGTSSSTRITLIRIPKTPRAKETDVPAIIQQILSPGRLEMLGEPSRPRTEKPSVSALPRKIESPIPTRTIALPEETAARAPEHRAPRYLNDVKCAIMTRLNGLTKRASPLFLCLTIVLIYAGIHVLLAVIAWRAPAYQFFVSSQICGVLALLMWRLTGTILI